MSTVRVQKLVVPELGSDMRDGLSKIQLVNVESNLTSMVAALPQDSVLVKVMAAAVNYPDLLMTCGGYQYKPKLPFVPGTEAAGVVIAAGSDSSEAVRNMVGLRVIVGLREGCMASHISVPALLCSVMPQAFSFAQGAAANVAFGTAYHCLVERAHLCPDDSILINGATGGVGMAAVQVAKALGCRCIIATGNGLERLRRVQDQGGATHIVDLSDSRTPLSKLGDVVKQFTGGHGVDIVYDPVGGEVFDASLRGAAPAARVLIVGFASGTRQMLRCNYALIKSLSVLGCRAGEHVRMSKKPQSILKERSEAMNKWATEGAFLPLVSHEVPVEKFADAFHAVLERRVIGKAVVIFAGDVSNVPQKARL